MIYVAKYGFKSKGIHYPMGSIIKDPTKIRFITTKVTGGVLIPVYYLDSVTKLKVKILGDKLGKDLLTEVETAYNEQNKPEPVNEVKATKPMVAKIIGK